MQSLKLLAKAAACHDLGTRQLQKRSKVGHRLCTQSTLSQNCQHSCVIAARQVIAFYNRKTCTQSGTTVTYNTQHPDVFLS